MNQTLEKFGYPNSTVFETAHWAVLIRPKQVTLGSCVLCTKHDVERMGDMPVGAMEELGAVSKKLETILSNVFGHEKINYLALMMVDRHFHFHVIPRYARDREFGGVPFRDTGWPKVPDLSFSNDADSGLIEKIRAEMAQSAESGE